MEEGRRHWERGRVDSEPPLAGNMECHPTDARDLGTPLSPSHQDSGGPLGVTVFRSGPSSSPLLRR